MNIIFTIHLFILLLGILIPLLGEPRLLRAYSIVMVLIFFHWMTNDNTCILTHIESMITGVDEDDTFINRVISPIYKMDDKNFIKTLFFLLWMLTQYRLGRLKIKEFTHN